MKENIKNPQNKPIHTAPKDFNKPLVNLEATRKEGPAVKPAGYPAHPSKESGFKPGANKPLDKSNYNDRKNPKGGCGCS